MADLGLTKTLKVGTYATMPAGVTAQANLSGADRYATNANVANWAKNNAGLSFTHTGLATGDKFPDALASGPYLAADDGILLLSPLTGPLPPVIGGSHHRQQSRRAARHLHRHDRAGRRPGEGVAAVGKARGPEQAGAGRTSGGGPQAALASRPLMGL